MKCDRHGIGRKVRSARVPRWEVRLMLMLSWRRSVAVRRARHLFLLAALHTIAMMPWLPPAVRASLYRRCGVAVGRHSVIGLGTHIRPGSVQVGNGCFINAGCVIDPGTASVVVGDRVAIGWHCMLVGNTHAIGSPESRAGNSRSADIHIENGSWLGAGVIVLPGVTIGAGCVIGAGSVVTKNTKRNGLYVGSPARLIRNLPST